jgi:hypothetical protein
MRTTLDIDAPILREVKVLHEREGTRPSTRILGELLPRRNVLLYGSDRSSDRHERARRFVETCAAGPEILCLTWPTLMAYLRIAAHLRTFAAPLNADEALDNVTSLVGLPHVRVVSEQDGFLDA